MPEINLVGSELKNYYDTSEISIQVNLNGFSFCINSAEDNRIHAFRHYNFSEILLQEDLLNSIDEILYKDDLLRFPPKKIRVIYTGRKSTLIPDEFFRTENLKSILEFNQPIDELDEIHHNTIAGCQSQLIFAIPTYFAGLIIDKFTEAKFYSQATPLLTYALSEQAEQNADRVIIQLNKEFFDIIIIREGRLRLYNTFLYVNATDLLYFVLYACKQLKIDSKKVPFYVVGEFAAKAPLMQEIAHHIPAIRSFDKPDNDLQHTVLKNLDHNRFFSLLHLLMCE